MLDTLMFHTLTLHTLTSYPLTSHPHKLPPHFAPSQVTPSLHTLTSSPLTSHPHKLPPHFTPSQVLPSLHTPLTHKLPHTLTVVTVLRLQHHAHMSCCALVLWISCSLYIIQWWPCVNGDPSHTTCPVGVYVLFLVSWDGGQEHMLWMRLAVVLRLAYEFHYNGASLAFRLHFFWWVLNLANLAAYQEIGKFISC
jgi:hypothetical protein